VAALNTVPVPEGVGVETQATIAFAVAAIGAVGKAIQNYRKIAKQPKLYSRSGYVLAVAGLALGLAGCVATTAPDGTRSIIVDQGLLRAAWDHYEALEAERRALETEQAQADAQRRAEIEAEIRALIPEIRRAAETLGVRGPG